MIRSLHRLASAIVVGYAALLVGLLYWQVLAAPQLLEDAAFNAYRLGAEAKANQRGRILDRTGEPLALSERVGDEFERRYPEPAAAPVTGFWTLRYGSAGLEALYDPHLRGARGAGAEAAWQRLLNEPVVGADIITTIDRRLQRATAEAIGDRRGAAVALDPRTGEVLAMVSLPYADPNRVETDFPRLREAPGDPLYNRATSGLYVPGSTFKVVSLAAGLETGVVTPDTVFEDPDDGVVVEHYRIPDPNHPGVARFNALQALSFSSNSAFAEIGMELERDRLVEQARRFGFESPIPFDLPTEASRLATDPNFLWSRLGLATTAIGQGQLLASPLQMALVAAGIANGGDVMRPRLVQEVRAADGTRLQRTFPERYRHATSAETARAVGEAMALGVRESWALTAALPDVAVAGKTGTAETDAGAIPHAWFIAFAPVEAPRVAVAVILEHAGGGAQHAGPVVRRMLEIGLEATAP